MRLFLMIALASLTGIAPASASPFDRAAWQQDYRQLKGALEMQYANLAWKASGAGGVDLPSLDRATTEALARASNDTEAADAIRRFVAGFHDGHLSELPYLAAATGPTEEPENPSLDPDDPAGGCAALGFASTDPVAFSLPVEQLARFKLASDGQTTTFRSGWLERSGVRLGLIRIQRFRDRAFPVACLHAWAELKGHGKPLTADAVKDAAQMRWFEDLASAIRSLREGGATALVIDVGRNGGGGDSGDWIPRMLTDRPVRSARLLMVDAPVSAGYFDEQIGDLSPALPHAATPDAKAALSEALSFFIHQKDSIGKRRCDMNWVWHRQRDWSASGCNRLLAAGYADGFSPGLPRGAYGSTDIARRLAWSSTIEKLFGVWSGPTYVIADSRSYSSAEMFVAVMKDNHVARIVGTRTGGDGCGFMVDGPPLVLAHSRLRFRIPNCMRLRADGSNEEAGIAPDLAVLPTEGESDRARAERAVTVIARDVAASTPTKSLSPGSRRRRGARSAMPHVEAAGGQRGFGADPAKQAGQEIQ